MDQSPLVTGSLPPLATDATLSCSYVGVLSKRGALGNDCRVGETVAPFTGSLGENSLDDLGEDVTFPDVESWPREDSNVCKATIESVQGKVDVR